MWIEFVTRAKRIFADRRAFYYSPGEVMDLPAEWAMEHIVANEAVETAAPVAPVPEHPFIPPSLGADPLTVACVWKRGGLYDRVDYVGPLARAVARNLSVPHRFVCLTDDKGPLPDGVERIPLRHGWRGFWSKIELYRPDLFTGPVLYLDLDTVICGDLGDIAAIDVPLACAWDLQRGWINSSLTRWSVDLSCVYEAMLADPRGMMRRYESGGLWGDQGLLQDTLIARGIPWKWVQQLCPAQVWWQPNGLRHRPAAEGTRAALWYGEPKPHELLGQSDWLRQNWQ